MSMFKDAYYIRARLFPALITSIPALIIFNKIMSEKYNEVLKNVLDVLPIVTHLGLSAAVIFLAVQVNRLLAKEIFQKLYFQEETDMPTTNFLLWKNNFFDETIKGLIRDKIQVKFGIVLLAPLDEQQDEERARNLITTAVSQIRIALKDKKMLLQHNIEYGFWRNLFGGCVAAVFFSALIFLYGRFTSLKSIEVVGIISFFLYLLPIMLSRFLIKRYGRYYAKVLYEQFLSL